MQARPTATGTPPIEPEMAHRSDHYAVLGLTPTATAAEIKAAFRRLAREHHPDANAQRPDAEHEFKRVARAYETLGNAQRRRIYDQRAVRGRFGRSGPGDPGSGPSSFAVDEGPIYHSDLGHLSDFYQAGDPMTVSEAAVLVNRNPSWLRKAIRERRLAAVRGASGYLVRRRDVESLDRTAARRTAGRRPATRTAETPSHDAGASF